MMARVAAEAAAEAASRKKQLLIYFATDYEHFRPLVTRLLSNITTPLFGLLSEEVGHIVYGRCICRRAHALHLHPARPQASDTHVALPARSRRSTALRSGGR